MTDRTYLTMRIPNGEIHAVEMEDEDSDVIAPYYVCGIGLTWRDEPVEDDVTCRTCRRIVKGGGS